MKLKKKIEIKFAGWGCLLNISWQTIYFATGLRFIAGVRVRLVTRPTGPKNSRKWPPPGRVFDLPGRGVLRFWTGGIQESRSDFGHFWPKIREIVRFRG